MIDNLHYNNNHTGNVWTISVYSILHIIYRLSNTEACMVLKVKLYSGDQGITAATKNYRPSNISFS